MLPTTENSNTTTREPVNRDFYDLDSLIGELNQPKEEIKSNQPNQQPGQPADTNIYPGDNEPGEFREPLSPDVAALSGKMIAGTIDTAIATGFSLYAKTPTPEKYQANEKQLDQYERAWTAVAMKYGYKVEDSPWFNVIILTIAIYLPHFQEAKFDRLRNDFERNKEEMTAQLAKIKKDIEELNNKQPVTATK